ncbi:hypothetical protein BESB_060900 [Besnoitia besnoiti]|uniref:Uncharacterized protein n=1 Tax=Besnoitia besnoiti TaxID=94643 RepID=A0A2A9MHT5_BESBE|nr:hypothetical protein BESB_060900 [Besnoitia besnoiti]PFH35203.1 hypothetical protein BESB_060900 [Besnoitia besnoiti]
MAPTSRGASEEVPGSSRATERSRAAGRPEDTASSNIDPQEREASSEESAASGESEPPTPGTVREELSKLVDGIAGEDGRIRLADFEKLSGCSVSILNALEMKLPRQNSWDASQVKEVLINEMIPQSTPPQSPVSSGIVTPRTDHPRVVVRALEPAGHPSVSVAVPEEAKPSHTRDLSHGSPRFETGSLPSPTVTVLDELAPPPPSPTSVTPTSPNAVTPLGVRTPLSPSYSSPRSRSQSPHQLMAAAAAAFRSVVPRLRLERLQRDAPVSADFMVSAPVVLRSTTRRTLDTPGTDGGARGESGETAGGDTATSTGLRLHAGEGGRRSPEELRALMRRVASPRHLSVVGAVGGSGFLGSPTGTATGLGSDDGGSALGTGGRGISPRPRSHTVCGSGRGSNLLESEQSQGPATPWLSPDLQEVAALLRQGEWYRSGGSADKIGDRHEYVGHGQGARYFERLDNVMDGDSMEQLVKRAKRKVFLYIQNAFQMPDDPTDTDGGDSLGFLLRPEGTGSRGRSLWSRCSPARLREAALEASRKDAAASNSAKETSLGSITAREELSSAKTGDDTSAGGGKPGMATGCNAGGNEGGTNKSQAADTRGALVLDRAHATQLKMTFLQMADFYLSVCYHLGALFSKEKENNLEERQHLQDTLDGYKKKVELAEQKLKLNFDLAQQQREQLDALERDIHARDGMDRRREGLISELQGRLKKQHQGHIEELRKRDEEAEESLRQYEVLKQKYIKMSDACAKLRERVEEADEKIATLTTAAAKRRASARSGESDKSKESREVPRKSIFAEEVVSYLAPPPTAVARPYSAPAVRRAERGPRMSILHNWSSRKAEENVEASGLSLLEEIQRSGTEMPLPQTVEKAVSESGSETEQGSTSSEPHESEAPSASESVAPVMPAAVVRLAEEEPSLPPPATPPESPRDPKSPPQKEQSAELSPRISLPMLPDVLVCPPPPTRLQAAVAKTVIRRFGEVVKLTFVRKWKELKGKKLRSQPLQPAVTRDVSSTLLELWEVKVNPEEPVEQLADLSVVGALSRQALILQIAQWRRRHERRHRRRLLAGRNVLQRLLCRSCVACSSCTAGYVSAPCGREHNSDWTVNRSLAYGASALFVGTEVL